MDTFRRFGTGLLAVGPLLAALGCGEVTPAASDEGVTEVRSALTDPVGVCNQDPRVNSGLVPLAVCAGARVFFDETFAGNGRTCGTCHPAANNFTLDQTFHARRKFRTVVESGPCSRSRPVEPRDRLAA